MEIKIKISKISLKDFFIVSLIRTFQISRIAINLLASMMYGFGVTYLQYGQFYLINVLISAGIFFLFIIILSAIIHPVIKYLRFKKLKYELNFQISKDYFIVKDTIGSVKLNSESIKQFKVYNGYCMLIVSLLRSIILVTNKPATEFKKELNELGYKTN